MGIYESVKGYIQRKKYQRLDPPMKRRRRLRTAKMSGRKRGILRLKLLPRLKFMQFNPKHLVVKLRDAYVNMMMNLSSRRVFSSELMGVYGNPFGKRCMKEYDPKMLAEMNELYMNRGRNCSPVSPETSIV
ncbi:hypothetical protein SUGI_0111290 [Cryptomeria japonica]|uniref:uncharacterized protein LOC131078790 n=1 Tax=Cryptomeria japonica TaxID=3369 RepID=UPI002408E6C2|nr:uncharacterized protein LOC131078790 [Cryptomeria japonica]GLJ09533.1 hypothetical protein SUGI_0111290 [Cryptomeria japonica]